MRRKLPKEPSTGGMIFTAVSGISLGILLAGFVLLREPPQKVKSIPATSDGKLGDYSAYYVTGSVASAESATVRSRISRLGRQVPGSIPFTEMEINHYMSQFKSADTDEEGNPADVAFSAPNALLEEDQFVLSAKFVLSPQKDRFEIVAQAAGRIVNRDDGPRVVVDRILLNSLPLPKFGGIVQSVFMANASAIPFPTEVRSSLGAIKEVELLEDQIVLKL